jgi:TolB protein
MKATSRLRGVKLAILIVCAALLLPASRAAIQQAPDWFRTGTGIGVAKARVAVADFAPGNAGSQPLAQLFSETVRADLEYSGILELVSKSFQPLDAPGMPGALNPAHWTAPPANAQFVAYGTLTASGNSLGVDAWFNDVQNPATPPAIGKHYPGAVTNENVRRLAHMFADEIVMRLSGGVPGIAQTRIAFVSSRSGNKEIWVMDYDGANQHQVSHLRTISLTPRWSPDATRIAFTCYEPYRGVTSAQICIISLLTGGMIAFPRFHGTNSAPAWSPDGSKIAFMSSMGGNPEIYETDASGGHLKRLTISSGVNTSAQWNPKTGQQIVFVSDRGGEPVLYLMNADGTNVEKLNMPDMGYVIDPAWSPNGQLLAFSWRRPSGNFDIYVMDVASRQMVELTRDAGRNERPSWAPDGRHLVFESTRTGTRQIWTMLADGTQPRQLTTAGQNESANWSLR